MVLSDFLSGQQVDYSDLHAIIPISFNMRETQKNKNIIMLKKTNFWYRLDPKLNLVE